MNPFVSNFLWAGGTAGRLGWCDTRNLVGVTKLHNRFHACLCVFHFSSLSCTSCSPIASFSRSKKTRQFLLSSCFLYLERKVRGWKTCRNWFFGSSCLCQGVGRQMKVWSQDFQSNGDGDVLCVARRPLSMWTRKRSSLSRNIDNYKQLIWYRQQPVSLSSLRIGGSHLGSLVFGPLCCSSDTVAIYWCKAFMAIIITN